MELTRRTTPRGARGSDSTFLFTGRRPAIVYRISKSFEQVFEPGHPLLHSRDPLLQSREPLLHSGQPCAHFADVHANIAHVRPDAVHSAKGENTEGRSNPKYRNEFRGKAPSCTGNSRDRAGQG